jgi:hypothetical protein
MFLPRHQHVVNHGLPLLLNLKEGNTIIIIISAS